MFMYKNNCCELQGDLRVRALLLHDFMAGVWSVIISNVINTFSTGAVEGSALGECVCFVCKTEKTQLCGGFEWGGLSLSFSLKLVLSKNDGVLYLLQQGYLFHSAIITLLIY